jgi:arginase
MAVKITRHPEKIVLLGVPTSAAAISRGHERAPAALRSAGIVDRLKSAGYEVSDHGDDPTQLSNPDPDNPRARNLKAIVKSLESLRPRVEAAVKTGALPIVLTGDCTSALATVAGVRRYFHNVSMIWVDRDADLNVPATTPSGCVDGMVVAHLTGRGAAELVRFWGEPPLVRDPDLAIFGVVRYDPPEEQLLQKYPLKNFPAVDVKKKGAAAAAKLALERVHASRNDFILHFDVDVIADFAATDYPGQGGLTRDEVREALEVFVQDKHLAAIDIAAFNPEKDADGSAAKMLVEMIGELMALRLETLRASASTAAEATAGGGAAGAASDAAADAAAVKKGGGAATAKDTATKDTGTTVATVATAAKEERVLEEQEKPQVEMREEQEPQAAAGGDAEEQEVPDFGEPIAVEEAKGDHSTQQEEAVEARGENEESAEGEAEAGHSSDNAGEPASAKKATEGSQS